MTTPNAEWRNDLALMGRLSTVNRYIAVYVMRLLDADATDGHELPVADEQSLGQRLVELGDAIQQRAAHRATRNEQLTGSDETIEPDSYP